MAGSSKYHVLLGIALLWMPNLVAQFNVVKTPHNLAYRQLRRITYMQMNMVFTHYTF